jgi:hypothetical protein
MVILYWKYAWIAGCSECDERDPYSFRITVVLNGEDGLANKGMEFRRFAEQTIRMETRHILE